MNFLESVLIVTVIFGTFYGIIELFVRRKERLAIIEKMSESFDPSVFENKFFLSSLGTKRTGNLTLKIACLLIGLGIGFLTGIIIDSAFGYTTEITKNIHEWNIVSVYRDIRSMIYTSSVLIFGGLGLLISYLVEIKMRKKEK